MSKEFVAASHSGVLIISKFAGSAYDLKDALIVNPNDIDQVADSIVAAFRMTKEEIMRRLENMKREVSEHNLFWWTAQISRVAEHIMGERSAERNQGGEIRYS